MAPRLLLTATTPWPTAGRLAAAFARLSWRVDVIAPSDAPVLASRFVETVHCYSPFAPVYALKAAILASGADLVIPCDDRALRDLLQLHGDVVRSGERDVAALIARSLGAPEHYDTLIARPDFIAAAAALGIAVPRTRAIANEADFESGLAELGLPVVLKVDGSCGGDGVAVAYSRQEARAAYRRMSRPLSVSRLLARALARRDAHHLVSAVVPERPRLSMQAFIAGTQATMSFAAWRGEVRAALQFDVVASDGETGPAAIVRRVEDPAMAAAAAKLARRFGLCGLHGLDFVRDASGAVHLLEINPRATQTSALALGGGGDLAAALTVGATDAAVGPRGPAATQDLVALFPQGCLCAPTQPALGGAHFDVPWDDPALLRLCLVRRRRADVLSWLAGLEPAEHPASLRPGNHPAIASER